MKKRKKWNIKSVTGKKLLRNGVRFISLILLCCQLVGCGNTPTTTLVICKIDKQGTTYYYDDNGNYYRRTVDDNYIYPIPNTGLKAEPVLTLLSSSNQYNLTEEYPTRYTGELADVGGYVQALKESGYSIKISEATSSLLEVFAYSDEYSIRIIYMAGDYVRIYCVTRNGVSCKAPNLSGGTS